MVDYIMFWGIIFQTVHFKGKKTWLYVVNIIKLKI